jgi:hypothetical protein
VKIDGTTMHWNQQQQQQQEQQQEQLQQKCQQFFSTPVYCHAGSIE